MWRRSITDWPWGMLFSAALLTVIGIAFINSATRNPDTLYSGTALRQLIWFGISLVVFIPVALQKPALWRQLAPVGYVGALAVLVLQYALAGSALVPQINGAHNWFVIGPLRLQPSEFLKLATLLMVAWWLGQLEKHERGWPHMFVALVIGGFPSLMLAREDLGSGLTFIPMTVGMCYLAGMSHRLLAVLSAAAASIIAVGIALIPRDGYQFKRILAWLDPEAYHLTTGYHTIHALRAVGGGGVTGAGYGQGPENMIGWLPENHTDMIFAVVGEETGLIGCTIVLAIYLWFSLSGLGNVNSPGRHAMQGLIIGGFTCLVAGQMAINIAVVLALMPVTGITLPFMSYGGSSLLACWLGVALCCSANQRPRL